MIRGNRRRNQKEPSWLLQRKRFKLRRSDPTPQAGKKSIFSFGRSQSKFEPSSPLYLLAICLVVAVVTAAFVFHLHVRFEGVKLGYETSQARAKRSRLLVERRELRLELASLKAPERVEQEARERLAMEVPDHRRIVLVGKQKKAKVASGGAR